MSGVDTFVDEGMAFTERHPELDRQQQGFGGLLWGAMRAVAECPNCPGRFRVPVDKDWSQLRCHACGGVWIHAPAVEAPEPKKAGRRAKERKS